MFRGTSLDQHLQIHKHNRVYVSRDNTAVYSVTAEKKTVGRNLRMRIYRNKVRPSSLFWAFQMFVHQICTVNFRRSTDVFCKPTFEGVSFANCR
jgi:hypothetical protein